MDNYVIRTEALGKRYAIGRKEKYRMLRDVLRGAVSSTWQTLGSLGRGNGSTSENETNPSFWALRDISFEIHPGDSVGIVGSNGAGKTTLLKILSRVTVPTEGRVRMRGRVGSLLEVGTGFHPELTGRENIYLNGAILGMRKSEIDRKFDEIVAFSEVEKFLDTPVKFYSSGMRVRLAFSVAAHLEPEILLVDEVLAVGDVAFQKKSLGRMEDVAREGRTVLFVSHNMAAVKSLCRTGIYLEKGKLRHLGEVDSTIETYLNSGELQRLPQVQIPPNPSLPVQILSVGVLNPDGTIVSSLPHDQPFDVRIQLAIREQTYRLNVGLFILDGDLDTVVSSHDFEEDENRLEARSPGLYTYHVQVPSLLVPGNYRLSVQAIRSGRRGGTPLDTVEHVCRFEIYDNGSARSRLGVRWSGKLIAPLRWECVLTPLEDGRLA